MFNISIYFFSTLREIRISEARYFFKFLMLESFHRVPNLRSSSEIILIFFL